jgi:hypothetical protein
MSRRPARLILLAGLAVGSAWLGACGGSSGDSGAEALVRQRELAEARREAAQDARQSAHIKQLEQQVGRVKREAEASQDASPAVESGETGSSSASSAPAAAASSGVDDWAGGTGYTAILASVSSNAEARAVQAEATGRGLDAGVLYSSDFSSLRPGYYVVFSGAFPTVADAAVRVERAQTLGYSDAYPRFVAP